jgi:hypothetical protein
MIDIKHLENVKGMILAGMKSELKIDILDKHSITDQLNADGEDAVNIKADIASILAAGHKKQESVKACLTFEDLELIVPRKKEEEIEIEDN